MSWKMWVIVSRGQKSTDNQDFFFKIKSFFKPLFCCQILYRIKGIRLQNMVLSRAHVAVGSPTLPHCLHPRVSLWLPDSLSVCRCRHTHTPMTSLFISAHCCRDGMEDISGRLCVCVRVCVRFSNEKCLSSLYSLSACCYLLLPQQSYR